MMRTEIGLLAKRRGCFGQRRGRSGATLASTGVEVPDQGGGGYGASMAQAGEAKASAMALHGKQGGGEGAQ